MAIDLTGISNINEFYSHHYLDSLLEGDLKGLYKKWKESYDRSPYEKLSGIANKYFKAKTDAFNEKKPEDRVEITHKFHNNFLGALGYETNQVIKYTEDGQALHVITSEKRDGNEYLWVLETVFWSDDTSVFEQQLVFENDEDEGAWFDDSIDIAIQHIFRLDEPPRWIVLLAGQKAYLIDRNKWGRGKYLQFDLDELFGRKQAETLKATAALLSKDALSPGEGNILHDELDENSHKHAFSVSEDLKYGIRRAVELIGNEFIYYRSKVSKQKVYGDEELASKLTKESLTYLYRLLFLFYAESRSEELNVVPMRSEEYRLGYSLETLRELEQVPLTTEASREGYFLNESLNTLFKIVNHGFGDNDQYEVDVESGNYVDFGFEIDGLQSPLFDSKGTPLLSSVKIRNFVLQEVIQLLSLTKEGSKQRGRISYAQLGINQLGAVYEGLLSYSGFFAQEKLFEVKPATVSSTDETGQSYFVPESNIEEYKEEEFVHIQDEDGTKRRKKYQRGSFIFRLAGRDREKSASYYTPEVLTKSLVKYSLKELLKDKTADEILELTICEPAMGSGAFLNETINQMAVAYLERKQKELGETINPDNFAGEKQRVKTYIATNNIYGVDLNPTAVELAKVSLWLNTIYEGSKTPWFSSRLGVGNSLIGVMSKGYKVEDVENNDWKNKKPIKLTHKKEEKLGKVDFIYYFLLPDEGMASFERDKFALEVAGSQVKDIPKWRADFTKRFTNDELRSLEELTVRIKKLWKRHYEKRKKMHEITKGNLKVWKQEEFNQSNNNLRVDYKDEQLSLIKESPTSSYSALKLVMDYWTALWYWPMDKTNLLPTRDEFLLDVSVILDSAEGFGSNINDLINSVPRLKVVHDLAREVKFFHWELEFPEVFFQKDGFDFIVGNPPWLKPKWSEKAIISDFFPLVNLRKVSTKEIKQLKNVLFEKKETKGIYLKELNQHLGLISFAKSKTNYGSIGKNSINLYKLFTLQSFSIINSTGIIGLLTDTGVYEDPDAIELRKEYYSRLKYLFKYINQLNLFAEESLAHVGTYCVNIFNGKKKKDIDFYFMGNLYHPKTIDESFNDQNSLYKPALKNVEGKWELKGHRERIISVNKEMLEAINYLYEGNHDGYSSVRLPMIHNNDILNIIYKLQYQKVRLRDIEDEILPTKMLDETGAKSEGLIKEEVSIPDRIQQMVLSGPHYYVGNPLNKQPRENCRSKGDYESINLLNIREDFLQRTFYVPKKEALNKVPKIHNQLSTKYYRYVNRAMAQPTNERTLISALIPPDLIHTNSSVSITFMDYEKLVLFLGLTHSIVYDGLVKIIGKSNINSDVLKVLPIPKLNNKIKSLIKHRVLRLNCLTKSFSEIWEDQYNEDFQNDVFSKEDKRLTNLGNINSEWSSQVPLRNYYERRQALVELDVLASISLGLELEELITLYKIQFPLINIYESDTFYDQKGNIVFTKNRGLTDVGLKRADWNKICEINNPNNIPEEYSEYTPPFDKCNREVDLRQAYEYFSKILSNEKAKGEINK